MTRNGRPLRFLALVLSGWVGARAVMLWPGAPVANARETILPAVVAASRFANATSVAETASPRSDWTVPLPPLGAGPARQSPPIFIDRSPVMPLARFHLGIAPTQDQPTGIIAGLPALQSPSDRRSRSRFFGSAWAVARGGSGPAGGVSRVQLGGSQAGLRLGYAVTADRRIALVGRASSPLGKGMRELALGVEWQPTRLPVRLVAEQRFALGQGRGGPTLAAVGGVGPVVLKAGFRLEAYAQGGVIARDGAEKFADGALRVARPVATLGGVTFDLGGGVWGAAQRGARRIDIGPSLSAIAPIGPQPVRLSLDWRQRVAGNAAPGSGLVVTLGADF